MDIELLRQYKIFGYAIFDLFLAFGGMAILSPLLSRLFRMIKIEIPKKNWVILALPIGIITHLLVGNITPMTADFFDLHSHYILKILIIGLTVWGLWDIKIIKSENQDNSRT